MGKEPIRRDPRVVVMRSRIEIVRAAHVYHTLSKPWVVNLVYMIIFRKIFI